MNQQTQQQIEALLNSLEARAAEVGRQPNNSVHFRLQVAATIFAGLVRDPILTPASLLAHEAEQVRDHKERIAASRALRLADVFLLAIAAEEANRAADAAKDA